MMVIDVYRIAPQVEDDEVICVEFYGNKVVVENPISCSREQLKILIHALDNITKWKQDDLN
jgi:hypothetical protein